MRESDSKGFIPEPGNEAEGQVGPPPLVEDLHDTNDLPEGYDLPEQSTTPDFDFDFDDEEESV